MASERVQAILRSKGAPFSDAELLEMSDREGWAWIYSHDPPKRKKRPKGPNPKEVCFTGFRPERKKELTELAKASGYTVRASVTTRLGVLCLGHSPGPTKIEKAESQGVELIDEGEFRRRCSGGQVGDQGPARSAGDVKPPPPTRTDPSVAEVIVPMHAPSSGPPAPPPPRKYDRPRRRTVHRVRPVTESAFADGGQALRLLLTLVGILVALYVLLLALDDAA